MDTETIRRKRKSLEGSISDWMESQPKFLGILTHIIDLPMRVESNDAATPAPAKKKKKQPKPRYESSGNAEDWNLGLPSSVYVKLQDDDHDRLRVILDSEMTLREGAAYDALHAVLLSADHLHALTREKKKNIKYYGPNTKVNDKIWQTKFQRNLGIADFNAHRSALIALKSIENTLLQGLPELTKADTSQKSVNKSREKGASKELDGEAFLWP